MSEVLKKEEIEEIKVVPPQSKEDAEISARIYKMFDRFRNERNRSFNYFRNRTLIQYINDSNQRVNNYRVKPSWKDEWQANISDITTHAKLMAIVAQVVVNRLRSEFYSRDDQSYVAQFKSNLIKDIYEYLDSVGQPEGRNGDIDDLFMTLKAAREGTYIGFEGYKKTKLSEGIDAQSIPLEDFYPGDLTKFSMKDQLRCVWRSVIDEYDFKERYAGWYQVNKVKCRGSISEIEESFFNISPETENGKVEILRWFSKFDDEFLTTANGILITDPKEDGAKLSNRRQDGELGFWKVVYEPFDDYFFYGRSLPDLMSDNQDAIDFLFNAMFDKSILSVLRPLLVGGVNSIVDDYLYPGRTISVSDVQQVQELKYEGPDLVSFRVLKELQDRQTFASVDATSSGISLGKKTATEVERAQEAAKRIMSLFTTMLKDGIKMKAELRMGTIMQYFLKKAKFQPIVFRNSKLISGRYGTKIVRIKSADKLTPTANEFGYSKLLENENVTIPGESEIWEITPQAVRDIKCEVGVRIPSTVEMSDALKKAFSREFISVAFARPDLYDQMESARIYAEVMNQDTDRVLVKKNQEQGGQIPGSELGNELMPTNKAATPSLKSLIGNV